MAPKAKLHPHVSRMFDEDVEAPKAKGVPKGAPKPGARVPPPIATSSGKLPGKTTTNASDFPKTPVSQIAWRFKKLFGRAGSKTPAAAGGGGTSPSPKASKKPAPLNEAALAAGGQDVPSPGTSSPRSPRDAISPRLKKAVDKRVRAARDAVSERFETQEKRLMTEYWGILVLTAMLLGTLSFCVDEFTFTLGSIRTKYTTLTDSSSLHAVIAFNVTCVVLARLIVRTTMEAEGSGFPEMKAMLFGKILDNYLTLRVMSVKAFCLAIATGAGLPIGKEGPNVHMAACISRSLDPAFYRKRDDNREVSTLVNKLLLASCSIGVAASFSAPIGGVVFALELLLPQVFEFNTYWGCFAGGIIASIVYATYRSWTSGAAYLVPLLSTNVSAAEGVSTPFPLLSLVLDMCLGAVCGLLGGLWIRMHSKLAGTLKRWRLRGVPAPAQAPPPAAPGKEPLLGGGSKVGAWTRLKSRFFPFQWRDIFLVAAVTAANTFFAASLPLLGGKPQPLLISTLFDKNLLNDPSWVLEEHGPLVTMAFCLLMKWFFTMFALSLPMPGGVVAPTMIIGGLVGRCFGMMIPVWIRELLLQGPEGEKVSELEHGAYMARIAILAGAAFCAAVCRAFAMAITVFEVLALPNSVLPLCTCTLTAIFVANRVSLPFFDANLAARGLAGIPALTSTDKGLMPAFRVMYRIDINDCLIPNTTVEEIRRVLSVDQHRHHFPIVRRLDDEINGLLLGSITRFAAEKLLTRLDANKQHPTTPVDLMDASLQKSSSQDGVAIVDGCPQCVQPNMTIRDVYTVLRVATSDPLDPVAYVTQDGCLQGIITFASLMSNLE